MSTSLISKTFFMGISLGLCLLKAEVEAEQVDISLTVYNQNFGLVRDVRYLNLKKGLNIMRFDEIPKLIERESLLFRSLTHPGSCWIQEQNFEYDLIDTSQLLLEKYLNKEIQILDKENRLYSGELLNYNAKEIILRRKDGTVTVVDRGNISSIEFPRLQEKLVIRPTLVWKIVNEKDDKHKVEVSYLTRGLNWTTEYKAIVSPKEDSLSLDAWVTLNNTSGVTYNNAALKLVAGEPKREREKPPVVMKAVEEGVVPRTPEFKEQELFEYHIYTLPRRITLQDNQQKQISFLTSQDIPIEKIYTFETAKEHWWYDRWAEPLRTPVKVTLCFKNDEKSKLGLPLPAGKVKVYKETESGLEFMGEDSILHTPKSEEVRLYIGNAFDIIGEKKHTEHKKITHYIFENTYEINLRNHKKEKVTIQVIEHLTGDWEIIRADHRYKKKDAFTIEFTVDLPPGNSHSLTYTVRHKI